MAPSTAIVGKVFFIVWLSAASPVLSTCPAACKCTTDRGRNAANCTFDIAESQSDIQDIPGDTAELILGGDSLYIKPTLLPYLGSLDALFLNNCDMNNVALKPEHLPNLNILDLTNTSLTSFPSGIPGALRSLILNKNRIDKLVAKDFVGLKLLQELFLAKNLLSVITSESFCDQAVSEHRATPPNDVLPNLLKLVISSNKIESVSSGGFECLKSLYALNLSRNKLAAIQYSTFEGLVHLEHLDLSRNKISVVEDGAFENMRDLKYLSLQYNRLTAVPLGLPMVSWLDISHNHIKVISEDHRPEFYAIERVIMGNNPFHCDCNLLWLKEFYDRREYQMKYESSDDFIPVCSSPHGLLGESWDVLDDAIFTCDAIDDVTKPNRDSVFDPSLLTVKPSKVGDTFVTVDWSIRGPPPAPTVVIQYYLFGERIASLKYVELAVVQRGYTLKHLKPDSNYVICVTPKITNGESLSLSPLSMHHCIEITTDRENQIQMLSYFWVFCYYILGVAGTVIFLFIFIGACALLGSVFMKSTDWSSKYVEIDEPVFERKSANKRSDKDESTGQENNKPHCD